MEISGTHANVRVNHHSERDQDITEPRVLRIHVSIGAKIADSTGHISGILDNALDILGISGREEEVVEGGIPSHIYDHFIIFQLPIENHAILTAGVPFWAYKVNHLAFVVVSGK